MAVIFDTNALSAFADGDEKLLRTLENEHELALALARRWVALDIR